MLKFTKNQDNILMLIAFICMILDHLGAYFFSTGEYEWLRVVGRIAIPIFAFKVAKWMYYTKDFKKYMIRLFIVCAITQVPMLFLENSFKLNAIAPFMLGAAVIYAMKNKFKLKFIGIILLSILSIPFIQYPFAIALVVACYLYMDKKLKLYLIMTAIIFGAGAYGYYNLFALIAIQVIFFTYLLIYIYDWKGFRFPRYTFHVLYPLSYMIMCGFYFIKL